MTEHSERYPPSGAWMLCPSWHPDPTETKASHRGSVCHALMEQWARWRLAGDAGLWTWPTTVETEDGPAPVLSEDVEKCKALLPKLDAHPAFVNYGQFGYNVWIEQKVDFGTVLGRAGQDLTGTCDLILMTPNEMEILDYKFGRHPVDPLSPQLKLYALGAGAIVWGSAYAEQAQQIRSLRLTVGQPALNPEKPFTSETKPVDQMVHWVKEAQYWVNERDTADGKKYAPSDKACYFCFKRNNCAARLKEAASGLVEVASPAAADAPVPLAPVEQIEDLTDRYGKANPQEIDDASLARILTLSDYLEGFLKDMREEAKRRLMAGTRIPGWKVIAGRRQRKWVKNENEIDALIRGEWKVPKEDKFDEDGNVVKLGCYEVKLKSPAAMEKMVHAQLSKKRKEEFANLWEMNPGKPVLAPEDDPAPALNPQTEWLEVNPNNAQVDGVTFDWE